MRKLLTSTDLEIWIQRQEQISAPSEVPGCARLPGIQAHRRRLPDAEVQGRTFPRSSSDACVAAAGFNLFLSLSLNHLQSMQCLRWLPALPTKAVTRPLWISLRGFSLLGPVLIHAVTGLRATEITHYLPVRSSCEAVSSKFLLCPTRLVVRAYVQ